MIRRRRKKPLDSSKRCHIIVLGVKKDVIRRATSHSLLGSHSVAFESIIAT